MHHEGISRQSVSETAFDLGEFMRDLNEALQPKGLIPYPFNVRWYNDFRDTVAPTRPQLIASDKRDNIGIIIVSTAQFFDEVIRNFDSSFAGSHFVDATVDMILAGILSRIDPSLKARGWNTDKPPYIHVQSIGHVAGVDEYICAENTNTSSGMEITDHRDPDLWGDLATRVLGVSIHPEYGGWYAYRMLIVLNGVEWPQYIPQMKPISFLNPTEREIIISEYNKFPALGRWRDFNDKQFKLTRYDTAQFLFFHEKSSEKRRRILELLKPECR